MKKKAAGIGSMRELVVALFAGLLVIATVAGAAVASNERVDNQLRLAVLPIPDVLPIYVAEANGYFAEEGIVVEALPVGSAVERDQLMQAGRIDGMINEVGGAALFNRDRVQMKIVSYARVPIDEAPLFRILAAPGSEVASVSDLAGIPVAVSKNTVIEYITGRLMASEGVAAQDIKFASVPVLPERMQLLLAGQIKAATLPDPLAFAALQAGAVEVTNDLKVAGLSASVISFSVAATDEKHAAIEKFMRAWDRAAADLNDNPDRYRELMLARIRVPKNVQQSFRIPPFPRGQVPSKLQWDDVQQWLLEKKLLEKEVSYEDSVTEKYINRQ
ncbi:ABC transporter substrate-binding protein [Desulfosediminicola ganghwensis]|uniref:ABC transporter substrate-binding protein n=1 Tax=Desulfosediminicola ganghwensis TaxID=2569540 RepID=UPI0010ABABBB|nr:ABC transporter substrate-binding protein [Desulfosediminicola ganghwensis]